MSFEKGCKISSCGLSCNSLYFRDGSKIVRWVCRIWSHTQGSLYYQPTRRTTKGNPLQFTIDLHCLIPPNWVSYVMIPGIYIYLFHWIIWFFDWWSHTDCFVDLMFTGFHRAETIAMNETKTRSLFWPILTSKKTVKPRISPISKDHSCNGTGLTFKQPL